MEKYRHGGYNNEAKPEEYSFCGCDGRGSQSLSSHYGNRTVVFQSDRPGRESNGKTANGENGYTIGCSFAASLDIPSCGELPSGKQFLAQPEVSSPDVSSEDDATPEDDNDADNQDEVDQDLQAQQEAAQNLINAIQHPVWMNLPSPAQVQESKRPQIINGGQSPAGASQCVGQRCF